MIKFIDVINRHPCIKKIVINDKLLEGYDILAEGLIQNKTLISFKA